MASSWNDHGWSVLSSSSPDSLVIHGRTQLCELAEDLAEFVSYRLDGRCQLRGAVAMPRPPRRSNDSHLSPCPLWSSSLLGLVRLPYARECFAGARGEWRSVHDQNIAVRAPLNCLADAQSEEP